ncbi:glutathione S-transferase [Halioglobus maricola]|uniref:Glutathione S-transferase n=1 Tax=Halioglobus maricola TaxID=2601894 RepID=A0A5P9NLC7_9GAMM|nr:MAPEG family protein [Halioglobus maricola]QFU75738.1 glutathione S-transferase [Halioglobus maricola]
MSLDVSLLYTAVLGLLHVPLTGFVALYRIQHQILLFDGGDKVMGQRMRAQANYAENVPIALILLLALDAVGAPALWLHALGATLVVSRIVHYITISTNPANTLPRVIGMAGTLGVILAAASWLLYFYLT